MNSSVYKFAIENTKNYIRSEENQKDFTVNVFNASFVLAIAFMKDKDEVLQDLLNDTIKK